MTASRPILPMPISVRLTGGDRQDYAPTPGFPWHNPCLPSDHALIYDRTYPPLATANAQNPSMVSCNGVLRRGTMRLDRTWLGIQTP
jgi:hypothetical protein